MVVDFKAPCWELRNDKNETVWVNPATVSLLKPSPSSRGWAVLVFVDGSMVRASSPDGVLEAPPGPRALDDAHLRGVPDRPGAEL